MINNILEEDKRLVQAVPTARQIAYQQMELFALFILL